MLIGVNVYSQNRKLSSPEKVVLDVTLSSVGKCPPAYHMKIGNIDRRFITSALYVYFEGSSKITPVLINDYAFNNDYFDKVIYPQLSGRKVKLKVEKYSIKGKVVYVAYEIE